MTNYVKVGAFLFRRDHRFIFLHLVFLIFVSISFFLTFHHVMWRDEAQAWLLARSLNVWQLFLEARHDGHPILWHLCLKVLQILGAGPWAMMLLNWIFITSAVWLLFYRSALPFLARIVVAMCPACLLHLSFNARNYAISVALAFLAATLYRQVAKKPVLFCFVLALFASTNVYAAGVFAGIAFQFVLEQSFSFGRSPFSLGPIFTRFLIPNLILAIGAAAVVAQLAPIPLPGEPTTGKPVLTASLAVLHLNPLIVLASPILLVFFSKTPGAPRIFGGIVTVALVLIPAIYYGFGARHSFMLAVEVVYFLWIYFDDILRQLEQKGVSFAAPRLMILSTLLISAVSMACQFEGFRLAFKKDSDSTLAARAIIQRQLDRDDTILITTDPTGISAVLLQLGNVREMYGPPPFPPGPMLFPDFFYRRMAGHVPSLEEMKPRVLELAQANPSRRIVIIACSRTESSYDNPDPNYQLESVYTSSTGPENSRVEVFQVFVLKR
jgi:hypothetical protein